jgi:hypothetical protein
VYTTQHPEGLSLQSLQDITLLIAISEPRAALESFCRLTGVPVPAEAPERPLAWRVGGLMPPLALHVAGEPA